MTAMTTAKELRELPRLGVYVEVKPSGRNEGWRKAKQAAIDASRAARFEHGERPA